MQKLTILLIMVFGFHFGAIAQTATQTPQEKIGKAVKKSYKSARKQMNRATHMMGEALGLEPKTTDPEPDDVKMKGYYYMPIYDVNLYHGTDQKEFTEPCLQQFREKYPTLEILSCVIPQTGWVQEDVKQNGRVIGYGQYLLCFILARDGQDGYVNARFAFRKYKEVGGDFEPIETIWPKWERTDVIPVRIYNKLVKL